jgi:putative DNA primase/helicase
LPDGIEQYLAGRHLVIFADNDDAGRAHAEKKAERAHAAGAASIRIIHFHELPLKADVSDFAENEGSAIDLTWTSQDRCNTGRERGCYRRST